MFDQLHFAKYDKTVSSSFFSTYHIDYLSFRFWIGMWITVILLLGAMLDLSVVIRYITRFTEECFALLIALIFIMEAIEDLIRVLTTKRPRTWPPFHRRHSQLHFLKWKSILVDWNLSFWIHLQLICISAVNCFATSEYLNQWSFN